MKYAVIFFACLGFHVLATFNVYEFSDAQQTKQFNQLIKDLRCPKCQNNNLADSNAPLASDIKNYVYQAVRRGESSEKITSFLISRYGQFITYRPQSILLWLLPTIVILFSLVLTIFVIYQKRSRRNMRSKSSLPSMSEIIAQYEQKKS